MISTTKKDLGQVIKIINKIIKDLEKQNKAKLRP
jgi:hypothetical protein